MYTSVNSGLILKDPPAPTLSYLLCRCAQLLQGRLACGRVLGAIDYNNSQQLCIIISVNGVEASMPCY
jgi:hypothetical protein